VIGDVLSWVVIFLSTPTHLVHTQNTHVSAKTMSLGKKRGKAALLQWQRARPPCKLSTRAKMLMESEFSRISSWVKERTKHKEKEERTRGIKKNQVEWASAGEPATSRLGTFTYKV
jgi:hypothetical protein